jgi:hypothetical protein
LIGVSCIVRAADTLFAEAILWTLAGRDSTVICEYLDALAGGGILIPRDQSRRWRLQPILRSGPDHAITWQALPT